MPPLTFDSANVTRVRVIVGEDGDEGRRAGKTVVAYSEALYRCPDGLTAKRCIQALYESDKRLQERAEETKLWDWQTSWWEPDPGTASDAGTVILRVAWYDLPFFEERRRAWGGVLHRRMYDEIGIPIENVSVSHWLAVAD